MKKQYEASKLFEIRNKLPDKLFDNSIAGIAKSRTQ